MSNQVPEGWSEQYFTEFADINPKLKFGLPLSAGLKVSFIKMEDVSSNAQVTRKHIRDYSEVSKGFTKFNDHDVLVAKITPCFENGKGGYVDHLTNGIGFGSTEFHVLRARDNSDSRYLYHYTNYPTFRLAAEASMCGTGGQRRVQTEFLKTHKPIFPPLPEQQKIAAILTSVDEVIEKTQAQIDKLKDLKTAMMQTLLLPSENGCVGTKPASADAALNNRTACRESYIPHTEFKDSPVGRIPKSWEVVKFKDIFLDYKYGPRFSSKDYDTSGNVKTIRGTDLSNNGIIKYRQVPIARLDNKLVETNALKNGDLVMITTADCGATAVFESQSIPYIASAYAIKLTPRKGLNSKYINYFMQTNNALIQVDSFVRKGTVANLPGSDVMSIILALPSIEEQNKVVLILEQLDKRIIMKQEVLKSRNRLKKALMQDLLTGKVRVNVEAS
jgi:type I restriction enzyme S subunit